MPNLALVPPPAAAEPDQLTLFDLGPDIHALRAIATTLGKRSQAENTERAYAADLRDFKAFCNAVGRSAVPASEDTLVMFVAERLRRLKLSTIQRRLCAVMDAHKREGHAWPGAVLLSDVMHGAARTKGTAVNAKAALTVADLRTICAELVRLGRVRDRALIAVGFGAGMRVGELVALELRDVHFVSKGMVLHIRSGKTDQLARGRDVGVFSREHEEVCPVRGLQAWLAERGRGPGPLFPGYKGKAIDRRTAYDAVKRACAIAGIDGRDYSPHSLRAGFVTAAVEAGTPESLILRTTGHRLVQTVARYARPAQLFQTDALARAM